MNKSEITKYKVSNYITISDLTELGYISNIKNANIPLSANELGEFCAIKIFEADNVAVEIDKITYDCKKYTYSVNVYKYVGTAHNHIKLNDKVENESKYILELIDYDYIEEISQ